ncbi:MAG: dephospho-CoA kinase [Candidatus Omnitrophica bacterium]|nr:dephospho-CoA kinase [Candidatus Omnitrophota bacterium]
MKKIIGLTGSFGSGKSTVARGFEKLGARVIDADALACEALQVGRKEFDLVVKLLGPQALGCGGDIDRKAAAEIIFQDSVKRKALEAIIHPYVFKRMDEEISESEENVIILDVPLLFETGLDQRCDQTIVVKAPEQVILERLREKGFSKSEIYARLGAQKPLEEKVLLADFVIDNQGRSEETDKQILKVWDKLAHHSAGPKFQSWKGK